MARTKEELFTALASTGLPYAAETWWPEKPPPLPYLLVVTSAMGATHADNRNALRTTTYRIELYTHGRSRDAEARVADALDSAGIGYRMAPAGPVDTTDVFETAYTTTVLGD